MDEAMHDLSFITTGRMAVVTLISPTRTMRFERRGKRPGGAKSQELQLKLFSKLPNHSGCARFMTPKTPPQRVTLRDIAERAGCHFATVSLALRNRPEIPEATRLRIRALAAKLGYRPDPLLASLASYRHRRGATRYRATLAWVTNFPSRNGWQAEEIFREYFAGAHARALELGFSLQEFWLREPAMTPARASQILAARGIEGLVMAPQPTPAEKVWLEWEKFSAVTIGYSMTSPTLHMVCPNQYRCIKLAMDQLVQRGYRRIGLVMLKASDTRVDHNWLAGYLVAQLALPARCRLAPLFLPHWDVTAFSAWLQKTCPEAIISKCAEALPSLARLGIRVPEELGVAMLTKVKATRDVSGMNESPEEVGAAAIDYLVGMIQQGERGVPAKPRRVLIEGEWIDGRTVRSTGGE